MSARGQAAAAQSGATSTGWCRAARAAAGPRAPHTIRFEHDARPFGARDKQMGARAGYGEGLAPPAGAAPRAAR